MKLIYDLGAHHGGDTAFYLTKGARVVAVEANPSLAALLRQRFAMEIRKGQCVVVEAAIMPEACSVPFFVNPRCDHWSSLSEAWATRDGGPVERYEVMGVPVQALFSEHGVPYYMKVDIEGADQDVVAQLSRLPEKPRFMSVEEWGVHALDALAGLGYDRFSIRTQWDKTWCKESGVEGRRTDFTFDHTVSGLFGLEVPEWVPLEQARRTFHHVARDESGALMCREGEFFDIHATRSEALARAPSAMGKALKALRRLAR